FRSKDEAELRINRARVLEVGLRSAQGRGGGTEFESLREYSADDEFRRVDWSATARAGKPIVRTYRAERNQTVIVLLDNGPLIARSHLIVVGAVRDPEVEGWAEAPAVDAESAYRRAAAIGALTERARLSARLRSLGVTVVDAAPGKLSGDLADTYLRLKATG